MKEHPPLIALRAESVQKSKKNHPAIAGQSRKGYAKATPAGFFFAVTLRLRVFAYAFLSLFRRVRLRLYLFVLLLLCGILASSESLSQNDQAKSLNELNVLWRFDTGGWVFSTPAVAEDLLYVGSCSGIFYALDKSTGSVKWSYDITSDGRQTSFHGDMLITAELVIIGTDGRSLEGGIGHLYAFERKTGEVRWKYLAGRGVTTDVLRLGDKIFAVTQNDELICLNVQNGQRDWAFASTYSGNQPDLGHSPALAGDQIFFGGRDSVIYALAANTGKLLWKRKLDSALSASLRAFENHVYVGVVSGRIYALNIKTGASDRDFNVESAPAGKFTTAQNLLFIFLNRSGVPGTADNLICLEPPTQKVRWRQPANPASRAVKPVAENLISATGNQCKIPELAWSSTSPYVWQNYILAGSNRGEIFAYRIADGNPAWSHKIGGTIRSFGSSGRVIYVGTVGGTIYACAVGHEASQ